MPLYEYVIGGIVRTIEADTWRRDLTASAEVVFIRQQDERGGTVEREVARLRIVQPYQNIRRLNGDG